MIFQAIPSCILKYMYKCVWLHPHRVLCLIETGRNGYAVNLLLGRQMCSSLRRPRWSSCLHPQSLRATINRHKRPILALSVGRFSQSFSQTCGYFNTTYYKRSNCFKFKSFILNYYLFFIFVMLIQFVQLIPNDVHWF